MTIDILPQGKAKDKKVAIKIYYADTSFFLIKFIYFNQQLPFGASQVAH